MRISFGVMALAVAVGPGGMSALAQQGAGPASLGKPVAITGRDARSRALYLTLIENLRQSGQVHAALAHLDAFDSQFPRAADAAILRGSCLIDIQDYAGATAAFHKQMRGSQAAAAYAGLGRVEALNGRWAEAAASYARAVQLQPTLPAYLSDYGFVLLRAGRPGDAVFRLRQAVQLSPGDARARNNLILALAASGDEAGARAMLARISDATQRAEIEAELAAPKS